MSETGAALNKPLLGIALKVLSVVIFMGMVVCIKSVSAEVPTGEIVFFRSFFAVPVILVWLAWIGELGDGLKTSHPIEHLWRGLIGSSAMFCGFASLALLPLPEVTAIGYAAPLLAVILAAMFLGEKVRVFRIAAVLLGMVGVVVILAPRLTVLGQGEGASGTETAGALIALLMALLMALAQVFTRRLVRTETTPAIVFYFSAVASFLALFTLPFGWVVPSMEACALLILSGVLGGFGQIFLTMSYRHAETGVVAPFEYTSMLLSIAVAYWIFNEVATETTLLGSALVMAAGLVVIWRERQLGLKRAKARQAMTPQG